jgi:hypothetical protein
MRKKIAKVKHLSASGFLLSLLLLVISPRSYAQFGDDWKARGYEGRIETVRAYVVEFDQDGKKPGKRRIESIERFDKSGRLKEYTAYSVDGSILYSDAHSHDAQGRLISTSTKHRPFTYLPDVKFYKYDSRGNLIETNGYNNKDELVNKNVFSFDDRNRRIEWLSTSFHPEEHSKPNKTTYTRYESGQVKDERFYLDEGAGFQPNDNIPGGAHRTMYFYNEHGKIISTLRFKSNDAFAGMNITRYDRRGNEIEEIEYEANGNLKDKKVYKYKYDRLGNWVEQTTYGLAPDSGESRLRIEEISYQIIKYYPERKSGK